MPNANKTELTSAEASRYSRQIKLGEIGYAGQLKLAQSHAVIIGLGGLGSPASMYLTSAGVGKLTLVDFDVVDDSNLQRQVVHREENIGKLKVESAKQTLRALNQHTIIETVDQRLDDEALKALIEQADVVLDCTDNFAIRFQLNRACSAAKKPLISAAAIRMEGQMTTYDFRKDDSPCYQCLYKEQVGQELNCSMNGVLAPLVGMLGSLQAIEAIKALLNLPTLSGRLLLIDAYTMNIRTLNLKKDSDCVHCGDHQS